MRATKIFKVLASRGSGRLNYRRIAPARGESGSSKLWTFEGVPKLEIWREARPRAEFLMKRSPLANFIGCSYPGTIVAIDPIEPAIKHILESAGELLPTETPDGVVWVVNVEPAVACLDEELTEGPKFRDGRIMIPERFVFREDALPNRSVFKPTEYTTNIFALQGAHIEPDVDFKATVERLGLKGLEFREVWNSSVGSVGIHKLFSDLRSSLK